MKKNRKKYRSARLEPFNSKYIIKRLLLPVAVIIPVLIFCFKYLNTPSDIELKKLRKVVDSQLYKVRNGQFDIKNNEKGNLKLLQNLMTESQTEVVIGKTIWLSFVCLNDLTEQGRALSNFMFRNKRNDAEFVTVFFGRDSVNWKHKTAELKLPGVNICAANTTNQLIKEYKINKMPHFVLLSSDGTILGMNMPLVNKSVVPDYILHKATQNVSASSTILMMNENNISDQDWQWLRKQMKKHRRELVK